MQTKAGCGKAGRMPPQLPRMPPLTPPKGEEGFDLWGMGGRREGVRAEMFFRRHGILFSQVRKIFFVLTEKFGERPPYASSPRHSPPALRATSHTLGFIPPPGYAVLPLF